jgi:hypothetical protein
MMATPNKAKVYYLPAAEPVDALQRPTRWARWYSRLLYGWWRTRLTLSDVRLGLWRPRRQRRGDDDYSELLRSVVEERSAELIERARPKRVGRPATILDFEAARLRLRPAN